MKIVHLTAGAGGFFCGTCIRDNALVRALRGVGHEAELVPMYLPLLSEGIGCSVDAPILMSGVNVYLQENLAFMRYVPRWMDAVFASRPILALAASQAGKTRPEDTGALTVSMLRGEAGNLGKEIDRLVDHLRALRPDRVVISNSLLGGLIAPLRRRLGVPVAVTLQGELHYIEALGAPHTDAAWQLVGQTIDGADARIAVSGFAADAVARRTGLDRARFEVVHNGVEVAGFGPAQPPEAPTIGFLARLTPEKGMNEALDLFLALRPRHPGLRMIIAGTVQAGGEAGVGALAARVAEAGVADEVSLRPNLSPADKRQFLRSISVFCVPTQKNETFGMYNVEALASGVPVVAPDRGAVAEVLRGVRGAVVVPPTHEALVAALDGALTSPVRPDPAERARWDEARMARDVAAVLAGL